MPHIKSVKRATLLILMVGMGCGRVPSDFGPFAGLVYEYDRQAHARGKETALDGLYIEFSDALGPHTLGDCGVRNEGGKLIRINRQYWDAVSEDVKELVLFHELGHCANGLRHLDSEYAIMNASVYVSGSKEYKENRTYYLDRHFSRVE